jgi:predicted MFS family arabinose efflux permease
MLLGWGCFYSFISLFLTQQLHFDATHVNLFMMLLAVGFGIGFGFIVNWLAHHFSTKQTIVTALILCGIISLITASATVPWIIWLMAIPIGMSVSVPYSMMIAVFSNQVDENSQGWVMGITNAIGSAAFAIAGFGGAALANSAPNLPIVSSSLFFLLSGVAMVYSKVRVTPKTSS